MAKRNVFLGGKQNAPFWNVWMTNVNEVDILTKRGAKLKKFGNIQKVDSPVQHPEPKSDHHA